MNDSHVSQTSLKNVLNQIPYLLFYERILEKKPEKESFSVTRKNSSDIHNPPNNQIKNLNNTNLDKKNIANSQANNESKEILKSKANENSNIKANNSQNVFNGSLNDNKNKFDNANISMALERKKSGELTSEKFEKEKNLEKGISSILLKPAITDNILNNKDNKEKSKSNNTESPLPISIGINEIMKNILPKTENLEKDFNKENISNALKKTKSFEKKIDLCDKLDEIETKKIKNKIIKEITEDPESLHLNSKKTEELNNLLTNNESPNIGLSRLISTEINTRSKSKPIISKRFTRLMTLWSKFGLNSQKNINKKIQKIDNFNNPKNFIEDLGLNENEDNNKINNNKEFEQKVKRDLEIVDNNIANDDQLPAKKRIFNTKINEIYHGHFIERWEDDIDDENELNKLRNQADFVRKSDAFKKQKVFRKSKYDLDYDAGKQKKVRIYEEKSSKGKNIFQQKHSNMLKRIKKMEKKHYSNNNKNK